MSPYNGNGCGYDGRGYGIGVPIPSTAVLDIKASVGTSTSPTSTGTKAVTGVGFQPKLVIDYNVFAAAVGPTTHSVLSLGAAENTSSRAVVAASSVNGVTTSNTDRRHNNAAMCDLIFDATSLLTADLSSFDSDGFTRSFSKVDSSAIILNHIALGGDDLEVSITQQQMNGTNAAQSFAHGLSGAPTGVIFVSATNNTAPPNTNSGLNLSIGASDGSSQFGASIYAGSGLTTTATRRLLATNRAVTHLTTVATRSFGVSSFDSSNVNVSYVNTVNSIQYYFWMIAIRGAKCKVGTFDCNGSTDPLTINCAGITPKLFMPVMGREFVSSINAVTLDANLTIGASDGVNTVSCGIGDRNGATTTASRRWQSSTDLYCSDWASSLNFRGGVAFSGESVVVTPTVNSGYGYDQGAFIIIGA